MTSLSPEAERARRQTVIFAGETDRRRWEDPASYETFWSDRSAAAALLCRPGQWVCDIGCGMQGLKSMLPADCTYLPADLRRWTPVVEVCDLNAGRLPRRHLLRCDIAVLLGVLEYIYDMPRLLAALARWAETLVLSYNCAELAEVDRAGFGWVNALTPDMLLKRLREAGFRPETVERFGAMEVLVRAGNTGFGTLPRLRRRAARLMRPQP